MKILLAPDKFKGSLTAQEVCAAIATGFAESSGEHELMIHPLADGGEGSLEILTQYLPLKKITVPAQDPLGRMITTAYYRTADAAYIEVAAASGLLLLKKEAYNPLLTSTFGTGQLIRHAIEHSCKNIYLFLGGSATNDGGIGIAAALGVTFIDQNNNSLLPRGENLRKIMDIDIQHNLVQGSVNFHLITDVQNPLLGTQGATYVYGPQKGGSPAMLDQLEEGMEKVAALIQKKYWAKENKSLASIPGTGAAGGIGMTLVGLFNAQLQSGIEAIISWSNFEQALESADLVISGEGKLDHQSLQGKVVQGVADLCKKHQKPLGILVGKNELSPKEAQQLSPFPIQEIMSLAENEKAAMELAVPYLQQLATTFANKYF